MTDLGGLADLINTDGDAMGGDGGSGLIGGAGGQGGKGVFSLGGLLGALGGGWRCCCRPDGRSFGDLGSILDPANLTVETGGQGGEGGPGSLIGGFGGLGGNAGSLGSKFPFLPNSILSVGGQGGNAGDGGLVGGLGGFGGNALALGLGFGGDAGDGGAGGLLGGLGGFGGPAEALLAAVGGGGGAGGPGAIPGFGGPGGPALRADLRDRWSRWPGLHQGLRRTGISIPSGLLSGLGLPSTTGLTQNNTLAARASGGDEPGVQAASVTTRRVAAHILSGGSKFAPGITGLATGGGRSGLSEAATNAIKTTRSPKPSTRSADGVKGAIKKAGERAPLDLPAGATAVPAGAPAVPADSVLVRS